MLPEVSIQNTTKASFPVCPPTMAPLLPAETPGVIMYSTSSFSGTSSGTAISTSLSVLQNSHTHTYTNNGERRE